jgi:hypothetical protein
MTTEISPIENDEISLKELIVKIKSIVVFLKSKWKIIFLISFIGASIGVGYAFLDKPTYKAVLTFAMEEDKSSGGGGLSGALGLASSFGIDLGGTGGGGAFAASNLTELMKSRLIVEKVLLNPIKINDKNTTLAEYFISINKYREGWSKNPKLKSIQFLPNSNRASFSLQQDSILKIFHKSLTDKNSLSISQKDKKVTILSIEVISNNENFAKLFCENIAKETSIFYIETKIKKAKINVDVLQKQVDSVRNELNGAINGVAYEADNIYNLNPALNIKTTPSKKKQIDVQANSAILTNLVVQLELAKITLRKETPLIQLIDSPIFPLEKEKTSKLQALKIGLLIGGLFAIIYLLIVDSYKKLNF